MRRCPARRGASATARSRGSSRRRAADRRTSRSPTTGARRDEPGRALEHLLSAAEHAGRGWAKELAVRLYGEALELVPEDDTATRRAITMRQVVASQAAFHLADAERQRPR